MLANSVSHTLTVAVTIPTVDLSKVGSYLLDRRFDRFGARDIGLVILRPDTVVGKLGEVLVWLVNDVDARDMGALLRQGIAEVQPKAPGGA